MQDLLFCPKCGASILPEDQFCTSCGTSLMPFKYATVESTPVITNTPVENKPMSQPVAAPLAASVTNTSVPTPVLHKVLPFIAVLLFIGLGVWSWWDKKESRKKNSFDTESVRNEKEDESSSSDNYTKPTITNPGSFITLNDFAGTWRAYEANNNEENDVKIGNPDDDLFIEVKNGSLDMYPRNEINKERTAFITCNEVIGNTINCRGKDKNENTGFAIKLELQSSKNEMTITIIPDEPTESLILKARRI